MNEYIEQYKTVVLKKYAQFDGKAGRKEFWMFVAVNIAISILISLTRLQVLSSLYSLAVLIPSIAVGIRRLHDTNRSGWWLLVGLVPIVGQIILIIYLAQKSKGGVQTMPTDSGQPEITPEAQAPAPQTAPVEPSEPNEQPPQVG